VAAGSPPARRVVSRRLLSGVAAATVAVLVVGLLVVATHGRGSRLRAAGPSERPSFVSLPADPVTDAPSTTDPEATSRPSIALPAPDGGGASAPGASTGPLASPGPVTTTPPPRPLSEPNRAVPRGAPAPDAGSGAVWPGDFPDPFVTRSGTTYYAFGTQSGLTQVQTLTSTDLHTWKAGQDALPRLPSWAQFGYVWGPSVLARSAGYVLYYATRVEANGRQCLSRAVSVLPQGPYVDTSNGPFICQLDRGGSIDPSPFVDADGTAWLLWKSEGTLDGEPTRIWSARLAPDGQSLASAPTELLQTAEPWEQPIIERPSMVRTPDGHHVMFYAGNRWQTSSYAMGWASCAGPSGPCARGASGPVLSSFGSVAGPGSAQEFTDLTGAWHVAYCAWTAPEVGYPRGARRLHLAALSFSGGRPVISP